MSEKKEEGIALTITQKNVPQLSEVRLRLLEKDEDPWPQLNPDEQVLHHVDEIDAVSKVDAWGPVMTMHGEIDVAAGHRWVRQHVFMSIRLPVLESMFLAANALHGSRLRGLLRPEESSLAKMSRQELESFVGRQEELIVKLRELIASRGEWHFTASPPEGKGTTS